MDHGVLVFYQQEKQTRLDFLNITEVYSSPTLLGFEMDRLGTYCFHVPSGEIIVKHFQLKPMSGDANRSVYHHEMM